MIIIAEYGVENVKSLIDVFDKIGTNIEIELD